MATKNIYLYEVTIKDESTGNEVPLHLYKTLIQSNSHILKGIIYATISVISGLCLVLIPQSFLPWLTSLLINVEITFMGFLIIYFILSLKEMSKLVKLLHNSNDREKDNKIASVKSKFLEK